MAMILHVVVLGSALFASLMLPAYATVEWAQVSGYALSGGLGTCANNPVGGPWFYNTNQCYLTGSGGSLSILLSSQMFLFSWTDTACSQGQVQAAIGSSGECTYPADSSPFNYIPTFPFSTAAATFLALTTYTGAGCNTAVTGPTMCLSGQCFLSGGGGTFTPTGPGVWTTATLQGSSVQLCNYTATGCTGTSVCLTYPLATCSAGSGPTMRENQQPIGTYLQWTASGGNSSSSAGSSGGSSGTGSPGAGPYTAPGLASLLLTALLCVLALRPTRAA